MKFQVQVCLPYIYIRLPVHATLTLAYPKRSYIFLKINICKIYCMISSYSRTFYDILYIM